jgi:hypothetical protein
MLLAESPDNRGDIGFLTKFDPSTIDIAVDLNAEDSACRADTPDHIFLSEFRVDFARCFGSYFRVLDGDIVDIQKYHNAAAAEIRLGSAKDCVKPCERRKTLRSSCHNRGVLTTGFSPQAIGTKACTRLSGLGTEPISPPTSRLVR